MPWIESHTVLIRHRKLIEFSSELRISPAYAVGHLHVLWHAALEQAEDGDLSSWSDEFIATSACYTGGAPRFVSLLQKHKWLEGRLIHDWLDYAGLYLTRKYAKDNRPRLVAIWAKHGRTYGVPNNSQTTPKQELLAPYQPTVPTNQPTKERTREDPPPEPPPDPNILSFSQKKTVPVDSITRMRIEAIHGWYVEATGTKLGLAAFERRWFEFLKEFNESEFRAVFAYLRKQVKHDKRNAGALKLTNLLDVERFAEDLALTQTNLHKPLPGHKPKPVPEGKFVPATRETLAALRKAVE